MSRVIDTATISRGIQSAFASGIPGQSGIPTVEQLQAYAATMNGMLNKADNITSQNVRTKSPSNAANTANEPHNRLESVKRLGMVKYLTFIFIE